MSNPIPRQCRAAVFDPQTRAVEIQDVSVPPLQPGEVLIRVECCNLCGSDLHTISGRRSCAGPMVLGHEIVGRVAALADAEQPPHDTSSRTLKVGERVTWSIVNGCGNCYFCDRNLPQKCEHLFKYGHSVLTDAHPLSGGLAEYCVLTAGTTIASIRESVCLPLAATINCAVSTASAAWNRVATTMHGDHILIIGAGMLGLAAAAIARSAGAQTVVVCDPDATRCERALRFGATHVCSPPRQKSNPIQALVQSETAARGFDAVIDMSANVEMIQRSPHWLRIGGQLVLIGSVATSPPVSWEPENIVRRMLQVQGVHNYNQNEFASAVQFVESHCDLFPWNELFSRPFALTDASTAIETAMSGEFVRVAITP